VQDALAALKQTAAREDANLMPGLLDAARAHVTEGEIVEALQEVFGAYTETPVF
jgi:methylmalonyl-CoA mutase, N-terminal domain